MFSHVGHNKTAQVVDIFRNYFTDKSQQHHGQRNTNGGVHYTKPTTCIGDWCQIAISLNHNKTVTEIVL